jgi:fumarate hydratase class II
VVQVAAQVVGNDAAVAFGATAGAFELNTAMPMMARNLLESIHLLTAVSRLLADRCVAGIEADVARCRANAESSPALATALSPHIGYEAAAAVVRQAADEGRTLRDVVLERGLLRPGEVDRILDVEAMTRGGVL